MDVRQAACQMGQRALGGFMALGFDDAPRVTSSYPPPRTVRQAEVRMNLNLNSVRDQEVTLVEFHQEPGEHYVAGSPEDLSWGS